MSKPATDDRLREIASVVKECNGNIAAAARKLGKSRSTIVGLHGLAVSRGLAERESESETQKTGEEVFEQSGDDAFKTLYSKSRRVTSVEDALKYFNIDPAIWEVERFTVNQWEVAGKFGKRGKEKFVTKPLHQVKVFLRRKVGKHLEQATSDLIQRVKKVAPKKWPPIRNYWKSKAAGSLLEISLFDVHFGKLCWAPETGDNYDLKTASEIYYNAVEDLVVANQHNKIDEILFPIGSDFFHVNGSNNQTANGTVIDADNRWPKIFSVGVEAMRKAIELASSVAPVRALWIPGNHDRDTSLYLCHVIAAHFHKNKHVHVDLTPKSRKYFGWGDCAFCFTHGDEEKHSDLPLIMAGEYPDWSKSRFREIHLGHLHKKKETQYNAGDTFGPVYVRILPSISGTDSWHFRNGYVKGIRAAQAFRWDKSYGLMEMIERPARLAA